MHHDMEHHGGDFGNYMRDKIVKQRRQFAQDVRRPASKIFRGVTIFVDGRTEPPVEELRPLIVANGGFFETYETSAVTHVICSNLPDSKRRVLMAKKKLRKPVLFPKWITDSVAAGKKLPIYSYAVLAQASPFLGMPAAAGGQDDAQGGGEVASRGEVDAEESLLGFLLRLRMSGRRRLARQAASGGLAGAREATEKLVVHAWVPVDLAWLAPTRKAGQEMATRCMLCEGREAPEGTSIAGGLPTDKAACATLMEKLLDTLVSECSQVQCITFAEAVGRLSVVERRDDAVHITVRSLGRRLDEAVGHHVHMGVGKDLRAAMGASGAKLIGIEAEPLVGLQEPTESLAVELTLARSPEHTEELAECVDTLSATLQAKAHERGMFASQTTVDELILKLCDCPSCGWNSGQPSPACAAFACVLRDPLDASRPRSTEDVLRAAQRLSRFQLANVSAVAVFRVPRDQSLRKGGTGAPSPDDQNTESEPQVAAAAVSRKALADSTSGREPALRPPSKRPRPFTAARRSDAAKAFASGEARKYQRTLADQWEVSDLRRKALAGDMRVPGLSQSIDPQTLQELPLALQREILRSLRTGATPYRKPAWEGGGAQPATGKSGMDSSSKAIRSNGGARANGSGSAGNGRASGTVVASLGNPATPVESAAALFAAPESIASLRVLLRRWIDGAEASHRVHGQMLGLMFESLVSAGNVEEARVLWSFVHAHIDRQPEWDRVAARFTIASNDTLTRHGYGTLQG